MSLEQIFYTVLSGDLFRIVFSVLWQGFAATWWFILPLILYPISKNLWVGYITLEYKKSIKWVYLEVKVPREVETTPKAMEQVFSGFSALAAYGPSPDEQFWKGAVPPWVSFEIMADKTGIHFYVVTPQQFRRLVETQFYSQYPQLEIRESENYVSRFTALPNDHYDIWGAQMELVREAVYSIKTYPFFEDAKEEKRLDPLTPLLEIMSHLKDGEEIWIQLVFRPLTESQTKKWEEEAKEKIAGLTGKEIKKQETGGLLKIVFDFLGDFVNTFGEALIQIASSALMMGQAGGEKKEEKKEEKSDLTPGQRHIIEDIEKKMQKTVFETVIRTIYVAPKSVSNIEVQSAAIRAYFRTFNIAGLNGFKEKVKVYTGWKSLWQKKFRLQDLKTLFVFFNFRVCPDPNEENMLKKMVLSAEELATLYHFPLSSVAAPSLYRLGIQKSGPPPNIPIVH